MEAASIHRHAGDGARRVEAMVARHGAALIRVANQFSLCHDDALDAYQRALEIFLRRLDTVDPATEGAWLRVVARRTFVTSGSAALRRLGTVSAQLRHERVLFPSECPGIS